MLIFQTLPTVYIDNNTTNTLNNISFEYEGSHNELPYIKKLKSGERKVYSIYNRGFSGKRTLYLTYYNKKLKLKEYQEIYTEFSESYIGNLLVIINGINKDGRLNIKIEHDFM